MVAHQDILLLLLPQDAVCTIDLKIVRQRDISIALDLDLMIADRQNRSRDPFGFQHQANRLPGFQIQIPDLSRNFRLVFQNSPDRKLPLDIPHENRHRISGKPGNPGVLIDDLIRNDLLHLKDILIPHKETDRPVDIAVQIEALKQEPPILCISRPGRSRVHIIRRSVKIRRKLSYHSLRIRGRPKRVIKFPEIFPGNRLSRVLGRGIPRKLRFRRQSSVRSLGGLQNGVGPARQLPIGHIRQRSLFRRRTRLQVKIAVPVKKIHILHIPLIPKFLWKTGFRQGPVFNLLLGSDGQRHRPGSRSPRHAALLRLKNNDHDQKGRDQCRNSRHPVDQFPAVVHNPSFFPVPVKLITSQN